MSKMIQIRNVPDAVHRTLKARAALEGIPMSDYLLAELRRLAQRPTLAELMDRLSKRTLVNPRISPAKIIREERDRR